MGKGDKRRPQVVTQKVLEDNWNKIFGKPKPTPNIKIRKVTPAHAITRVEEDKTKRIPRRFNLSISSYNYLFLGLLNGKSLSEKNIELLSLSLDRVFFLV